MATPTAPTHPDPSPVSVFPVSKAMASTAPSQVVSADAHISVLLFGIANNRDMTPHRRSHCLSLEDPSLLLVEQRVSDSDELNDDDDDDDEGFLFFLF